MRIAVAAVLIGMAAMGVAAPANANPNSDDPNCVAEPYLAECTDSGFGAPTGPSDSACISSPIDPVCAGGPYAPPAPAMPPPVGSDLPGSMMPDGMPYGSGPPPGMPGSIPGMPGSI
ncbi:hypothetical protein [Mycobacterium sp. E802]|uniref:hypothetical protein n=1 Tax=Mycobacterium sp. E802 TaxID=1834152 RepID=UPI000A7CAA0F|nr:hypothetical protein [Mycobacterium sp. E802]